MRIVGLDVGDRRIGVASGDTNTRLAVPAGAIERSNIQADVQAVLAEAAAREAELIVVGMPLSMSGRMGPQAESVEAFIQILGTLTGLKIVTMDERLSTVEATRRMREGEATRRTREGGATRGKGKRGKTTRGDVDASAAAIILQSYLDSVR